MSTNLNEVLQSQLVSLVQSSVDAGKVAVDFVVEQSPLLVQEVLRFGAAENAMYALISAFALYLVYRIFKSIRNNYEWIDENGLEGIVVVFGTIIGSVISIISVCMLLESVFTFVKILVAPRLYLMEYLSTLVKF